ncbi:Phosphatidylinositol N-acetylglucosaminyltransferase subunit A, partial [Mucuna pruriens]
LPDFLMGDSPPQKHRILMVCDFFYPNFGGVENHVYYLSQCLLKLGHKVSISIFSALFKGYLYGVVVVTHAYGNRSGVRYMTGGLKVYYVPWRPFFNQNTFPTLYGVLPIIRTILIRERITVVHGHQTFSTLSHDALLHARIMGYKVVFTDHSLHGFGDVGSIHMNKVMQFTMADISQAICVSHTSKENTVLRSGLAPEKVFVIPNAVDTAMFKPALECPGGSDIVIVVISRLVYRKGADLLVEVIPQVCRLHPNVRFIIGGDGSKRVRLEEMREKHSLFDRVDLLGAVPHAQVRSVLISGHIFLTSLTEAFCMAILEAASCGLLTVSTRVGGVPEVLPDDMIVLAEPNPGGIVHAIQKAIFMVPKIDPQDMHNRMRDLYNWHDVAKRTEIVYDRALKCPNQSLLESLSRYLSCGAWSGKLFSLVMILSFLFWHLLELLQRTLFEGV